MLTFKRKIKRLAKKTIGSLWLARIFHPSLKYKKIKNKTARKWIVTICMPITIIVNLMKARPTTLPYVEMDLTSRCTLNCKECARLIPNYKEKGLARDYDINELLNNIDLLYPFVSSILMFRLLGGEPLLHKQLFLIVNKLTALNKIKHIQINTNGTIIPNAENIAALRHKKVSVCISNYGELSTKKEILADMLKRNGITVFMDAYQPVWGEIGGIKHRGYTAEKIKEMFSECSTVVCKSLYNGKLWICPFAMCGASLGVLKDNENEYINLHTCNKKDFWKKLKRLYNKLPPGNNSVCNYCATGGSTYYTKEVPSAEQI